MSFVILASARQKTRNLLIYKTLSRISGGEDCLNVVFSQVQHTIFDPFGQIFAVLTEVVPVVRTTRGLH